MLVKAYSMGIHACVSLRDGASSAVRSIKDAWEYLSSLKVFVYVLIMTLQVIKAQKASVQNY